MGRPSKYNDDIAYKICEFISNSSLGIHSYCEQNKEAPCAETVYRWLGEKEEFRNNYARAKELQAEYMAKEIIEISDEISKDTIKIKKGDIIYEQENKEWINRSKLRVDTRKWLMSKLHPKKYGDKIEVEQTGTQTINVVDFRE